MDRKTNKFGFEKKEEFKFYILKEEKTFRTSSNAKRNFTRSHLLYI